MDTPFEILGVDPDADEEEIVRAYRRRVKEVHPDVGGSAGEFQLVRRAYEDMLDGHARELSPAPAADDDDEKDRLGVEVEYLNYDVLADHGWNLHDDDLFAKAAAADLDPEDYGRIDVEPRDYLLEGAERHGFGWPFACRGGACANCAVAVVEGELEMPADHILSEEMMDEGIRLSCIGVPISNELKVVYNIKHLPGLDELQLPAQQFKRN